MKIIKVRKNNEGDFTNVMTDTGEILSLTKAVALAKDGEVECVTVTKNRNGTEIIKGTEKCPAEEKLENLPEF
ncbi:hypothetical protein SH2C18_01740 [Clostridium sediminicola]|uniref:DUF3892 domain-containing protein n=1 Tax=Clostridium sediminicola TaxID=3114879 RepID=UPI0031F1C561